MSRHEIGHSGMIVIYGYDYPLTEYFIQVWNPDKLSDVENMIDGHEETECEPVPEDHGIVIRESSYGKTRRSNSEMWQFFKNWGVPENHLSLVMSDLPIPQ